MFIKNHRSLCYLLSVAFVIQLSACATQPVSLGLKDSTSALPPLPTKEARIYHIEPAQSQLRVLVFRTGALADIGHNHVLTTSTIKGNIYVQKQWDQSGFKLYIPVESFNIDPPEARAQEGAGFESTVSDDDRAGTRHNMLGKDVLDAAQYPRITLHTVKIAGPPWRPRMTVRIQLHGHSHDYVIPTAITRTQNTIIASGGVSIKQSDFGITPFSVLAGALRIKDTIRISFHFVARASGATPTASVANPQ